MLVEDARIEADHFLRREGVKHAADAIDFASDVLGSAAIRALEHHMLNEMGNAVEVLRLATRAAADPDSNGNGAHMGHRVRHDNQTVGESRLLNRARDCVCHVFHSGMSRGKNHADRTEKSASRGACYHLM